MVAFQRIAPAEVAIAVVDIARPYTTAYVVAGLLSLVVVIAWAPLCGWFISLSAARPIAQIARLTGDISQKGGIDAGDRLPEAHTDELGELAAGTNRMLARLQDSFAAITEKQRLEKEVEIANRLQTSILPRMPKVDGLEIAAVMAPATEVGGDYYDVLPVEGGCWLGIGDVAGHGLTSGLVMLQTQSAVSALVEQDPAAGPRDVLVGLNSVLYENIRKRLGIDEHMTMSLVRYHRDGRLVFAGAHEDILIWRAATKTCELVPTPGTWLGIRSDIRKATVESSCQLQPGDVLVLYTDGLIEAMNAQREQFGTERLVSAVAGARDQPVQGICDHVMTKVRAWSDVQADDITLVVSRYEARS
ncbi:MAG: SpoIIE family protein phosphatase [Deltaproteobacteria bacterium]|nr:SpoIIE family protein phosphatase [Deltaproteobacteria bacterium]